MLLVLKRHRIAQARRTELLCEAIACGSAPGHCGKEGMQPYHAFMDRMRAIALDRPQTDDSAAEDRAWSLLEQIAT